MRISISGADNLRKSELMSTFMYKWRNYTTPETCYKDIIEQHIENKNTTSEIIQREILNDMINNHEKFKNDTDCVLFNRCPLDNIIYTLFLNENKIVSDDFVQSCIPAVRESMKFIDIIFIVTPADDASDIKDNDDITHQINNLFSSVIDSYMADKCPFFDEDDKPAIITINGSDFNRIENIKQYINESGDLLGSEVDPLAELNTPHLSDFFPDKVPPPAIDVDKLLKDCNVDNFLKEI